MSKKRILKYLEKKGYHVTFDLSGWIIAAKIGSKYRADTLNGLYKLINSTK